MRIEKQIEEKKNKGKKAEKRRFERGIKDKLLKEYKIKKLLKIFRYQRERKMEFEREERNSRRDMI